MKKKLIQKQITAIEKINIKEPFYVSDTIFINFIKSKTTLLGIDRKLTPK